MLVTQARYVAPDISGVSKSRVNPDPPNSVLFSSPPTFFYNGTALSLSISLYHTTIWTQIIPPHQSTVSSATIQIGKARVLKWKTHLFSNSLYSKTLLSLPMSLWLLATLTRIIPPHKCRQFRVPHYRFGRLVYWNEKPTYSPPVYILRHYWVCPCLHSRQLLWQGSFHHTSFNSFQNHITDWEGLCVEMKNQLILHHFIL